MRLLATFFTTLCASTVLAAELPFDGVYGDQMGCARLDPDTIPDREGGITVHPDALWGYEWGCTFSEVWPYNDDQRYGVQGVCMGEGQPSLEQFIIELDFLDRTLMTVWSATGEPRWQLTLCQTDQTEAGKG